MVAVGVKPKKVGPFVFIVPVNEKGEEDWTCPRCGSQLRSCCGNSHIWCYNCGFELWNFPPKEFGEYLWCKKCGAPLVLCPHDPEHPTKCINCDCKKCPRYPCNAILPTTEIAVPVGFRLEELSLLDDDK